jgi:3D-(3,5/4)-trihydroxycyclohexane-1,2-dione acylhydrolase (decyclizing)
MLTRADKNEADRAMRTRASAVAKTGGLDAALANGALPKLVEISLSEALVLGLMKQGVRKYFAIFGHGSTDLGNVLRIYEEEGATRTINCRNEVEMAHAATALRWQYGEISAVITSIGPGAMQAFAGSLAAASNGIGVYHIYGDETTFGEGYNMQQVPKEEQGLFGRMTAVLGQSYILHTPSAVRDALRRGALCVNHPYRAGPFYLLLPLNTQPAQVTVNLAALPVRPDLPKMAPADDRMIDQAAAMIAKASRIAIKAGGGTRGHDAAVRRLAEAAGAAVVLSPG